jgi:hypothetical protein
MENEKSEFFKLDIIDRKVLFWIMENSPRAISSWIEYTVDEYCKKKSIIINATLLATEVVEALNREKVIKNVQELI